MRTVFVLFDSLNRTALGCYGGTQVATPNFDRFAERALSYDNHYVGSLPCMPARRDMHTGRLNFMHRSWGPIEPYDNCMPEMLHRSGVHSHLISDHFHYFEDGGATYHSRFKTWEFIRGQENDPWIAMVEPPIERFRAKYDTRHYDVPANAKRLQHQVNREFLRDEADFPGPKCFERAFRFLDLNREADDWFLQLECFDPHEPFHAPERFLDAVGFDYDGPILDWPNYAPVTESPEEIAAIRANYAALVAMCDAYFGKLLDYFDQHDLWKDTCLIVTTDHGFLLSEHDWWGKNQMPYYEEISHIPMMVHHPERPQDAGKRTDCLTQTPDLMPTILGLHGLRPPPEVTGRDIHDIVDGRAERDAVAFGMFGGPVGVTDGQYSYFRYPEDLRSESLGEYTLMPTHLAGFFEPHEIETMQMSAPFDFTKGLPLMRFDALNDARRPPGLDGADAATFQSAIYDNRADPCQLTPLTDAALEARLSERIVDVLSDHDTPPEFYDWMGLTAGPATSRPDEPTQGA